MNTQNQNTSPVKRTGGGCFIWLGRMMLALVGLALAGFIYEPLAEAADAKAYPPPGQLVDVGGYRLHIHCTGTGGPTVVIEAGLGDWSTGWGFVQPEVAKTTRVCTYDRAGSGWSDQGPLPRDAAQFARELHTLLHNAEVPGPYVLVGHSLGGLGVRVFVHEYASEVAGVVLIDSMTPQQFTPSKMETPAKTGTPSKPFSMPALLARFGIVRLLAHPLGIMPTGTPDEEAYFSRLVRVQNVRAFTNESLGMPAAGAEATAVTTFGDLPLIVLTAKLNPIKGWQEWQAELLQLSSHSEQLFAESDHSIHFEKPEAAVTAILKMVDLVRQTAQK
ncbi:MAG TPA: alpha/beta hydrolase [Anaerolineales bacterium]|nr:alpha/beta hydrolase [Anaerolineales bacterium]